MLDVMDSPGKGEAVIPLACLSFFLEDSSLEMFTLSFIFVIISCVLAYNYSW